MIRYPVTEQPTLTERIPHWINLETGEVVVAEERPCDGFVTTSRLIQMYNTAIEQHGQVSRIACDRRDMIIGLRSQYEAKYDAGFVKRDTEIARLRSTARTLIEAMDRCTGISFKTSTETDNWIARSREMLEMIA